MCKRERIILITVADYGSFLSRNYAGDRQKTETGYYSNIFGFHGDFLFAGNMDEARLMVVQNNGIMSIDKGPRPSGNATTGIPLCRKDSPITRHYCAFWKTDNSGYYVEEFTDILKAVF